MKLPALSRADRLLLSIVLLLAALGALAGWLFLPPEKTGGIVKLPSTFYNAGYGAKATYLALERMEYPTKQLRRPIDETTLEGIGVLFVLTPTVGLMDDEVTALEDWVKAGHCLVVAPGRPFDDLAGAVSTCDGGSCGSRGGIFLDQWFALEKTARKPEAEEKVRVDLAATLSAKDRQADQGDPLIAGIGSLVAGDKRRFNGSSPLAGSMKKMPAKVFWKDKLGTVALRTQCGEGTIVALADTYPLSNLGIGEADNGLLLGNMVREMSARYPGGVAFDEYHLGFPLRDWSSVAIAKLTFAGQWRWAVAQAALVGILAMYAGAVRFGSPRDVVHRQRRQRREFAEAAGRLLDEAKATSLAAETLYGYYRGRLCRLTHLESDTDDGRLSQAVHKRSGREITALLRRATGAAALRPSRQELLETVKEFHRVVETLDHGT
jgi:hypothetical protein